VHGSLWDDVIHYGIGTLLFSTLGALAILFAGMTFIVFDSSFIETSPAHGAIQSRSAKPRTTVTTFMTVGNIQVPQTRSVSPKWEATVELEGVGRVVCPISEAQYKVSERGKVVEILIGKGRFSGEVYCEGVR
jgi:hypothetical protein